MKKINRPQPKYQREENNAIENAKMAAKKNLSDLVTFSFKYLQCEHEKFSYIEKDPLYFCQFIDKLKQYSTCLMQELLSNRSNAMRFHPIKWTDVTEDCFGIPNEDQLVDTPYQFSLSSNEYGRIHGFTISSTFYVVWFDPGHLLYESKE